MGARARSDQHRRRNRALPYYASFRGKPHSAEAAFAQSALQSVCRKLAAWIGEETRDQNAVVMAITSALMTVQSEDSDAYRWGEQLARNLHDPAEEFVRCAPRFIKRARKRWRTNP